MRAETKKEKSLIELLDLRRKNAELEASGVTKLARTAPGWMKHWVWLGDTRNKG